jgi:acyl-CoA thioesterase-1
VTRRHALLLLFTLCIATPFHSHCAAPTKPANRTRPIIVCFGDSLTAGHGVTAGQTYPDYLQRDLDSRGYAYHVINKGIDGNTTKDGVDRLKDVLALHPQIVVVEFGGNDGLRGLPISVTRQNLDQIVSTLLESKVKVVLAGITLPPNYGQEYIQQFNETYATIARKYKVPFLPFLLKNVYGVPGSMQEDGIHATDKGNQQVALNVLQLLQPLLGR